jgi:hypothetical protein
MTRLLALLLRTVWTALVIAVPLAGVWLASSLAAYAHRPPWVAAAIGLLFFPLAPFAWEIVASARRARSRSPRPRFLTLGDRITLRTLAINVPFLAALLLSHSSTAFAALSTRGDWMLGGARGPTYDAVRSSLFAVAEGLEGLHRATHPNPYEAPGDGSEEPKGASRAPEPDTTPSAAPDRLSHTLPAEDVPPTSTGAEPLPRDAPRASDPSTISQDRGAPRDDNPDEPRTGTQAASARIHPLVENMPPEIETSIAAVAKYIVDHESDPVQRARIVHDWVADRISYDGPAFRTGRYPPQDAESVFRARKGVCAGYSHLFVALAKKVGLDAAFVVGDVRGPGMRLDGEPHAWNAVKAGGGWSLVDVTWDSGYLEGATFRKRYSVDYLMPSPDAFGIDHYPHAARWQLRDAPISRGAFLRQPLKDAA